MLTLDGFYGWLKSLDPGSIAGNRCLSSVCPLARYLKSQGASTPLVGIFGYTMRFDDPLKLMPYWAQRFVFDLDMSGFGEVTAAECLRIVEPMMEAAKAVKVAPRREPMYLTARSNVELQAQA